MHTKNVNVKRCQFTKEDEIYTQCTISMIISLSQIPFQSILILAGFLQFTAFLDDVRESLKRKKLKFQKEILHTNVRLINLCSSINITIFSINSIF